MRVRIRMLRNLGRDWPEPWMEGEEHTVRDDLAERLFAKGLAERLPDLPLPKPVETAVETVVEDEPEGELEDEPEAGPKKSRAERRAEARAKKAAQGE